MFPMISYNCHYSENNGTNGTNKKKILDGRNRNNRMRGNKKFTYSNGRYINNKYLKNYGVKARNVTKGANESPMSCDN